MLTTTLGPPPTLPNTLNIYWGHTPQTSSDSRSASVEYHVRRCIDETCNPNALNNSVRVFTPIVDCFGLSDSQWQPKPSINQSMRKPQHQINHTPSQYGGVNLVLLNGASVFSTQLNLDLLSVTKFWLQMTKNIFLYEIDFSQIDY